MLFLPVDAAGRDADQAQATGQLLRGQLGLRKPIIEGKCVHLTLLKVHACMGEAPHHRIAAFCHAAGRVRAPTFEVLLDRAQSFRRAFVLFGNQPNHPTTQMRFGLRRALRQSGCTESSTIQPRDPVRRGRVAR